MSQYQADIAAAGELIQAQGSTWNVDPENVARMKAQNRFRTGLILTPARPVHSADVGNHVASVPVPLAQDLSVQLQDLAVVLPRFSGPLPEVGHDNLEVLDA